MRRDAPLLAMLRATVDSGCPLCPYCSITAWEVSGHAPGGTAVLRIWHGRTPQDRPCPVPGDNRARWRAGRHLTRVLGLQVYTRHQSGRRLFVA
jgi:hypothetical protein